MCRADKWLMFFLFYVICPYSLFDGKYILRQKKNHCSIVKILHVPVIVISSGNQLQLMSMYVKYLLFSSSGKTPQYALQIFVLFSGGKKLQINFLGVKNNPSLGFRALDALIDTKRKCRTQRGSITIKTELCKSLSKLCGLELSHFQVLSRVYVSKA